MNEVNQPEDAGLAERLATNPYLTGRPSRNGRAVCKLTPALKRKVIEAIAKGASPTKAAKAIGLARSTLYYQRGIDPDFAEAWGEAQQMAADSYEDALEKAALRQGNIGGIIFGLKNLRPDRWKDRHEVDVEKRSLDVQLVLPSAALPYLQEALRHPELEAPEAVEEEADARD